nr:hypothetical protein [Tanacetum cinerariifolium]
VAPNPRVQNVGNQNGLIGVQGNGIQNQIMNGNLVAVRAEGNAAGQNGNQALRIWNFCSRAFPSYEAKHRLEIHFHVERKLGFLRAVSRKELGEESANESGSKFIPSFDSSFVGFVQPWFCFSS